MIPNLSGVDKQTKKDGARGRASTAARSGVLHRRMQVRASGHGVQFSHQQLPPRSRVRAQPFRAQEHHFPVFCKITQRLGFFQKTVKAMQPLRDLHLRTDPFYTFRPNTCSEQQRLYFFPLPRGTVRWVRF
jgi:hypothetical protein